MDSETVKKVAAVARIALTEDEARELCSEMEKILDYFSTIREMRAEYTKKAVLTNPLRSDRIERAQSEPIIEQFTKKEGRYLAAPKTL